MTNRNMKAVDIYHAHQHMIRAMVCLGFDVQEESIRETPDRWLRAMDEMCSGYATNPKDLLSKTFKGEDYDEMIAVGPVEFSSLCEHHLLPFTGKAWVAYVPEDNCVVGLSKLPRLVECFARRLQLQERMTVQIARAIQDNLNPRGVGVVVKANHQCMGCRGVRKPGAFMVTSKLFGCFMEKPEARAELMSLVGVL